MEDRVEAGVGDVMQGCGELGGRTVVNVESGLTGVRQEVEGSTFLSILNAMGSFHHTRCILSTSSYHIITASHNI